MASIPTARTLARDRRELPHVSVETRKVYRSVRGCKLTSHAAYIAAAKQMIADACDSDWVLRQARLDPNGTLDSFAMAPDCDSKHGEYTCRFHTIAPIRNVYEDSFEGGAMEYYHRVLPRLVRFLKFVDARHAQAAAHHG